MQHATTSGMSKNELFNVFFFGLGPKAVVKTQDQDPFAPEV